jgi:galactose mutarotase-like enzyme
MYKLDHRDGTWPLIDLIDVDAGSILTIVPARGGLVTRWCARHHEVLFLDEATFQDAGKNVRGGIPVLFPSPGKLAGDRWSQAGRGGQLKQHGFARNLPWRVVDEGTAEEASVTLQLEASDATRDQYPYDFEAKFRYALRGSSLHITMHFANRGADRMPFATGFHPYFALPGASKPQAQVETRATRAFDNVAKREVAYHLDLTGGEVDLHLIDHATPRAALVGPKGKVVLEGSPEFTHWVVWSLPDRDFICLEPWTSPPDALNTGDRLLWLEPGETRTLTLTMQFQPVDDGTLPESAPTIQKP